MSNMSINNAAEMYGIAQGHVKKLIQIVESNAKTGKKQHSTVVRQVRHYGDENGEYKSDSAPVILLPESKELPKEPKDVVVVTCKRSKTRLRRYNRLPRPGSVKKLIQQFEVISAL